MANASNTALITFPLNGGAPVTITDVGIGYAASPAVGVLYACKTLAVPKVIAAGASPVFNIGELDVNLTSSTFEAAFLVDMLEHYFNNLDHANIGDAAGLQNSAADGVVYVSLHTASPAGGDQTTSETTYTNYVRMSIARSALGFTIV